MAGPAKGQGGATSDVGAIAGAVDSIYRFYGKVVDFFATTPRRIARQHESARPDALRPGQFDTSVSNAPIYVALGIFGLLILIILFFSIKRK